MSYIQINIGGKDRGLKFNQLAIEVLSMHNDGTAASITYGMIYGGLRGNSYVKREEPDYTFEQVCDWVDGLPDRVATIGKISKCLADTQLWQELVTKGKEILEERKEDKKKAPLKKEKNTGTIA